MKNRIYKAAIAVALGVAITAPMFTVPVQAGGTTWYWEDEEPLVTALWGKYSKFDGKLVYRISDIDDSDFYVENVEEVKAYGFEVIGEYVNERGETYYKFKYTGGQAVIDELAESVASESIVKDSAINDYVVEYTKPDNGVVSDIVVEEPAAKDYVISDYVVEYAEPDNGVISNIVVEEPAAKDYVISDYVVEYAEPDNGVISDIVVEEPAAKDYVISDYVVEYAEPDNGVVSDIVVEEPATKDYVINDYVVEYAEPDNNNVVTDIVIEQAANEEGILSHNTVAPLEGTENCTVGHCESAKEIIWEEVWTIGDEIETPDTPDETVTTMQIPNTDIVIPWYEELLHDKKDNILGHENGKDTYWEWEGTPQVNPYPCKKGACYYVDMSEDFSFKTENVDWILECGFTITGETVNNNGQTVYAFTYVG